MVQTPPAIRTQLEQKLAKLLKKHFGRGAESIYIQLDGPAMTIHLRQFLAPMEQTLLTQNDTEVEEIERLRDKIMRILLPSIQGMIDIETNETMNDLYYDWHLHPEQSPEGMIWGLFEPLPTAGNQNQLQVALAPFRQRTGHPQGQLNACWIGNNQLLIEKEGALKAIEHELIHDGYEDIWRQSKKASEKKELIRDEWERLFQRKIQYSFMDWNVHQGKEYLVLCFEKRPERAVSIQAGGENMRS